MQLSMTQTTVQTDSITDDVEENIAADYSQQMHL